MRSIGEFRTVPEITAGFVQHAKRNARVEIQSRGLMVFAVYHDHVAGPEMVLNGYGKLVRGDDGRKGAEGNMHARQESDHHNCEGSIASRRPVVAPEEPIQSSAQQ